MSCWRTAVARRPRHELRRRRLPQSQRSPARDAAWSGSGGAAFARSSSQSAHETLLLTIKRKAFTWAGVHSSQSSTGTSECRACALPSAAGAHLQPRLRCGQVRDFGAELTDADAHPIGCIVFAWVPGVEDELINWPLLNSLPKNREKPYHNLLKIDLLWRNLSEGALYAGLSNRVSTCHSMPGSSSLYVVSSFGGGQRAPTLCDTASFTQRSGALACDFGQQNDNRQANQPDQNPNRDPTHGFSSLSVMGRFRGMRRLCNLHHCSVLSQKEACTRNLYFQFTPAIQRRKLGTKSPRRIGAHPYTWRGPYGSPTRKVEWRSRCTDRFDD